MKKVPINSPFDEIGEIAKKTITPMQRIEMNPMLTDLYQRTQASEKVTCEIGDLHMPTLLAQAVQTMKAFHPERPMHAIINTVLAKTAQVLAFKRIKYVENGNTGFCNHYAINFMPSGAGKDRMSDELDKFVFYPFRHWFKFTVETLKAELKRKLEIEARQKFPDEEKQQQREKFVKEQMREFGNLVMEVSDGTREGLFRDAKVFKKAKFAGLMVKIAELGLYLYNMTTEQKLFFNMLLIIE